MNQIYTSKQSIILPKEICEVPYSNEVNYATFSRVLNDMAANMNNFNNVIDESLDKVMKSKK